MAQVCCEGSCHLILCFIYLNLNLMIYMEKNITATRSIIYAEGKINLLKNLLVKSAQYLKLGCHKRPWFCVHKYQIFVLLDHNVYIFDMDQVWVHDSISVELTRAHDTELMPLSCWLLLVKEHLICKKPCVYEVNPFEFLNKVKGTDGDLFSLWGYSAFWFSAF